MPSMVNSGGPGRASRPAGILKSDWETVQAPLKPPLREGVARAAGDSSRSERRDSGIMMICTGNQRKDLR
jgi:hypothetical protein